MLEFILDRVGWSYLDVENYGEYICTLNLDEAEELLKNLTSAVADLREANTNYVQVRFDLGRNSAAQSYTYNDPSGKLKVGDLVQAPVYDGQLSTAKVVALGRGKWNGPVKDVATKLEPTRL